MRRRLLIAAVLLLILAPFVLLGILLYTPGGLSLIGSQLWRLERSGVHISGLSGTVSGPLRIQRFELNHPRVHVVAQDIVIHTQLRGLLLQTLQASSVTVGDAAATLRDVEMPPSTKPPRFLPQFLRVDAKQVDIAHARYQQPNGMVIEANGAQGRVTMTARTLRVREGRVAGGRIDAQQVDATGELILRAGRPVGMEAKAKGQLRMTNGVVLTLDGHVKGDLDRLEMAAQLLQPQRATATAVMTRPDERWNIVGHVDAAALALDALL
jgi:translocation and assembly module TamB